MNTLRNQSVSGRSFRTLLALLLVTIAAVSIGCASAEPHITAKVIFQDDHGVAAELSSEWR